MSNTILVRRQKFARELRRKEVSAYMQRIRQRLLKEPQQPQHNGPPLSDDELQQMRQQMEDEHYSTASIQKFLLNLKQYSTESLCRPELFATFERVIRYVLQWGMNAGESKLVHNLSKQLILRAIECAPNKQGRLPLEFCFKEVLQILANQDMQMVEIWKAMALVRSSEYMVQHSFMEWLCFLETYPDEINHIVSTVLEVFANFTTTIEGHQKVSIDTNDIYAIIGKLDILLANFTFGDTDLAIVGRILENIIKLKTFSAVVGLLLDSQIIPSLLQILDNTDEQINKEPLVNFFIVILSGPDETTKMILNKYQGIITCFSKLLPGLDSVALFSNLSVPENHNWPSFEKALVRSVMTCFCNMVACKDSAYAMLKYNITNWFMTFSSYNDPTLRAQVAIFLFNLVMTSSSENIQILLEKGLLFALNNVIREEYFAEATIYGLRALLEVLKEAKNFPTNNIAWYFSLKTIIIHCERMELIKYLQGLLICKKQQLAHYAQLCLNELIIDQ